MIAFPMTKTARKALLLVPVMAAVMAMPAFADTKFKQFVSPGGITAWMVEDHSVPIITMGFGFRAGAIHDPEDKAGLSGLTGAMMTEATERLDSDALAIELEETGLEVQMSTDRDFMWGDARAIKSEADQAFSLLAEIITTPRFDEADLDRVRRIGIENIRSQNQDPEYQASVLWAKAIFGDHPYSWPDSGTVESLQSITTGDLKAFHAAGLSRDTLKIGIVGDLTEEEAGALIDKVFAGLPETSGLPEVERIDVNVGDTVEINYPLPQTSLRLTYRGIPETDPDFYKAQVLIGMLGGDMSSLLNTEIREKRGLSYGVGAYLINLDKADTLIFTSSTEPQNSDEARTVMLETFDTIAQQGPSAEDVERYKNYLIGSYALNNLASTPWMVATMVMNQLTGKSINYVEERTEAIEAVDADGVKAVAARLFANPPTVVSVGPKTSE